MTLSSGTWEETNKKLNVEIFFKFRLSSVTKQGFSIISTKLVYRILFVHLFSTSGYWDAEIVKIIVFNGLYKVVWHTTTFNVYNWQTAYSWRIRMSYVVISNQLELKLRIYGPTQIRPLSLNKSILVELKLKTWRSWIQTQYNCHFLLNDDSFISDEVCLTIVDRNFSTCWKINLIQETLHTLSFGFIFPVVECSWTVSHSQLFV